MQPLTLPERPAAPAGAARATRETVLAVRRWTDALVSLRLSRSASFRFTPGHYARVGLAGADGMVVRPLSIASAASAAHLDFLCTLVPGGAFSALAARAAAGDAAQVERASFGFLTVDALAPGRDLWLVASGTGIAPFLSILREPGVWRAFERIVVVLSVRTAVELVPADEVASYERDPASAPGPAKLTFVPVVTREPGATALASRIPDLLDDGRLEDAAGAKIEAEHARVMTCGNPALAQAMRQRLSARGFRPTRRNAPGQMSFENYWTSRS